MMKRITGYLIVFVAFFMIIIVNYKLEELKGYSCILFVIMLLGGNLIKGKRDKNEK